jgi:hypothetical protein
MIHNTAAKRRSKTHLTFVGCVLLCARDGICIYIGNTLKEDISSAEGMSSFM